MLVLTAVYSVYYLWSLVTKNALSCFQSKFTLVAVERVCNPTHKNQTLKNVIPLAGGHGGLRRRAVRPRQSRERIRRNQGRSQRFDRFGNQNHPPFLRPPARNPSGPQARNQTRVRAGDPHGGPRRRGELPRRRGGAGPAGGEHRGILPGGQPRRPGGAAIANAGGGEGVPRAARGGEGAGVP